jgi:hypothetical protein
MFLSLLAAGYGFNHALPDVQNFMRFWAASTRKILTSGSALSRDYRSGFSAEHPNS